MFNFMHNTIRHHTFYSCQFIMFFFSVILVILIFFIYGIRTFNYWRSKGIKHDRVVPFFGTNAKQYFFKGTLAMVAADVYKRYPEEKVVGFYNGTTPALIIRDPDIVKRILVNDFQHFHGRGLHFLQSKSDYMAKNFFMVDGDLWRLQRQKFTPAFSTNRLKAYFPIITERAEKLQALTEEVSKLKSYDAYELMARYTTEVAGACGFGLNMDCLNDENSKFRELGINIFKRTLRDAIALISKVLLPKLSKNVSFFKPEVVRTIRFLVKSVIEERKFQPSVRNDFIDTLLELRQKGLKMTGVSIEKKNKDGTPKIVTIDIDDSILVAQVFLFFGAGFETSSGTSSYTLHQLAFNPEYQDKVQNEIDSVLLKHNNKITYDAVKEMKYLQMAFNEAMRMKPRLGTLLRVCTSSQYTIPEVSLTIDQGVGIIIPIEGLQNDSKYFDEPEKFKPERFNLEENKIPEFVYLPFGEGPRACAGLRLGVMQSLAALVGVLQKFRVEPASCSVPNPPRDPTGFFTEGFSGGLPLKFRKRNCL